MTLPHTTKVYGSKQCKIAVMTDDPEGGTTTYGTSIVVPGIRDVDITGNVNTELLEGDNTVLDSDSTVDRIDVAITWAKFSFDLLAAILAQSAAADAGAGSAETVTLDIVSPIELAYFSLEVRAAAVNPGGGDLHYKLWKLKASSFPTLGTSHKAHKLQTVNAIALPRLSDGKWIQPKLNETAVVIA